MTTHKITGAIGYLHCCFSSPPGPKSPCSWKVCRSAIVTWKRLRPGRGLPRHPLRHRDPHRHRHPRHAADHRSHSQPGAGGPRQYAHRPCPGLRRRRVATEQLWWPDLLQLQRARLQHRRAVPQRLRHQPRQLQRTGHRRHRAHRGAQGPFRQPVWRGDPGGLVNIVSKRPQDEAFTRARSQRRQLGPLPHQPGQQHAAARRRQPAVAHQPGGRGQRQLPRPCGQPPPDRHPLADLAARPGHHTAAGRRVVPHRSRCSTAASRR